MTTPLSPNTEAILLLTAPLIAGRGAGGSSPKTLTPAREYAPLAQRLYAIGHEPADLITEEGDLILEEALDGIGPGRVKDLLSRRSRLSRALEQWKERSIWVLSRADDGYPKRLKRRFGWKAPPILYGCGDDSLIDSGGLAVVGPRAADEDLCRYARDAGRLAARAGRSVVSGAAKGIDREAMGGALEGGGKAIGVLSNGLARAAASRANRDHFNEGRLLLVSPYDPEAPFSPGRAMDRNKYIYALADAALVVDAVEGKGGTWQGAAQELGSAQAVRVYARAADPPAPGLEALKARGAKEWPELETPEDLADLLDASDDSSSGSPADGKSSWASRRMTGDR